MQSSAAVVGVGVVVVVVLCLWRWPRWWRAVFGTASSRSIIVSPQVYHPTNFGRPDIWMNTTVGTGLAMVALDDAFRVHGECWQSAVPSLNPRMKMTCPVTAPPSIRLADPRLALSPGETHTVEWALFPQVRFVSAYLISVLPLKTRAPSARLLVCSSALVSSMPLSLSAFSTQGPNCSSYFCFVNAMRHDM